MRILKSLINTALILTALVISIAQAEIDLSLDRNDIRVNETFQLTIQVEDPASLSAQQTLDFLPPEFQVLGSEHFRKSTVIDRQFANRMGWTVTLISQQAGTFTIPQFTIGNEKSNPITIRVLPALQNLDEINPNSKIKLTARLNKEEVYVQEQIIYSLRIYSSVASRRHYTSPLQVENAIVKKLGEASEFQLLHKGVRYNVKEEKYVIFPQQSGELSIPPVNFRTNIVDTEASFGSLSRYRPIELKSQPFKVQVKPKPETALAPWIPAKTIELQAKWQEEAQSFEVGKPATLDFYIKGVGILPEQLPSIEFPEIDGLKIYRDKPVIQNIINANGVNSYHLEKLAIIPNAAGEVTIPAVKIAYWNTTKDEQAFAELAPITIDIKAQTNAVALPTINQATPAVSQTLPITQSQTDNFIWKVSAITFATLWLLTSVLFLFRRQKVVVEKDHTERKEEQRTKTPQALNLKQAIKSQDPAVLSQAIIRWADEQSETKISNLNQLIAVCSETELKHQLQLLQSALYASDKATHQEYNSAKIYQLLNKLNFSTNTQPDKEGLPPLYPQ